MLGDEAMVQWIGVGEQIFAGLSKFKLDSLYNGQTSACASHTFSAKQFQIKNGKYEVMFFYILESTESYT